MKNRLMETRVLYLQDNRLSYTEQLSHSFAGNGCQPAKVEVLS